MANEEQLSILKQGSYFWNKWRKENPTKHIDLSRVNFRELGFNRFDLDSADFSRANLHNAYFGEVRCWWINLSEADLSNADLNGATFHRANMSLANLKGANLQGINLQGANLQGVNLIEAYASTADLSYTNLSQSYLCEADLTQCNIGYSNLQNSNLRGANLCRSNLRKCNLHHANLGGADLGEADLREANLQGAYLQRANLNKADLSDANLDDADLSKADLRRASLVGTQINNTKVSGSSIYGINVWDLIGEFKEQKDLIITNGGNALITVDNIKVAQFIYLILKNEEIRGVINTLTSKSILILGRFALPERKAILDALKNKFREYNLLPIVFDFDRPTDKDFTETIKTLAGLCYFVIADVTNPKSAPLELQATVPDYQIPFVPIIQEGENPFAMMVDLQKKYNWVLNTVSYDSEETLMKVLKPLIIDPAMKKRQELRLIKAQEPEVISGKEYVAKGKK